MTQICGTEKCFKQECCSWSRLRGCLVKSETKELKELLEYAKEHEKNTQIQGIFHEFGKMKPKGK